MQKKMFMINFEWNEYFNVFVKSIKENINSSYNANPHNDDFNLSIDRLFL